MAFREDHQALEIANASVYGLNAGVFTQSINRAIQAGYALSARVHQTGSWALDAAAFGGSKQSGLGREGTVSGLEEITQVKSIVFRNALG